MRKWWKVGYWAWPWNDFNVTGPLYSFIGLGPWTVWWEGPAKTRKEHRWPWIEWNIDEWDDMFESSQDFLSALAVEAIDDFRAGRTDDMGE